MLTIPGMSRTPGMPQRIFEDNCIVEEIRRHAYRLYVRGGKQDGWDRKDWLTAEDAVLMKYAVLRRSPKSSVGMN
jgi:hypothetical protein